MEHMTMDGIDDRHVIGGFRLTAAVFGVAAAVLLGKGESTLAWGLLTLAAAALAGFIAVICNLPLASPKLAWWHLGYLWAWVIVASALLAGASDRTIGMLIAVSICTNIAWVVAAAANGWGPLINRH